MRLLGGAVVRLAGGGSVVGGRGPLRRSVHPGRSARGSAAAVGRGTAPLVHGRELVLLRGAVLLRRPACTECVSTRFRIQVTRPVQGIAHAMHRLVSWRQQACR